MIFALGPDGISRIRAEKTGDRAICPGCKSELMAKCGEHVAKHWSHHSAPDCDPWYDGMSEWHSAWQELFPDKWIEVRMPPHSADVRTPAGLVLEIQHSPIGREAADREAFYGDMVWVVDASGWRITWDAPDTLDDGYVGFHFVTRKPSLRAFKKPTFLDFGPSHNLFRILWPNSRFPVEGWRGVGVRGEIVDRGAFVRALRADEPIPERPLYAWPFFDSKLRAEAKRKEDVMAEIRRATAEARRMAEERLHAAREAEAKVHADAMEESRLRYQAARLTEWNVAETIRLAAKAVTDANLKKVESQRQEKLAAGIECPSVVVDEYGELFCRACEKPFVVIQEGDRADRAEIGQ